MKEWLRFFFSAVLVLAVFGLITSANALTEKEQWEKEYGDAYRLQPLDIPVILDHGGPDPGGYYYIDSFDPALNHPVFDWTDISGIGTPITLGDDSNAGPFDIGFDFTFYGITFNQFYVCSNGWVSFTSTSTSLSNVAIPSSGEPNNLLAIFWDDLNPNNGGQVYYYSDPGASQLIISYDGVPHYSNTGSLYFQAVLDGNDSSIVYHYGSMDDAGHGNDGSTVGIENSDGTVGTQYLFDQAGIVDSMAVYFGFEPPIFGDHEVSPVAFVDFPPYGMVGDDVAAEVTFINQGSNTETFPVRLIVNFDGGEVYNQTEQVTNLDPASSVNITFPTFTSSDEGVHEFVAISELAGDENPANDTLRITYTTFASLYIEDFEVNNGFFVGDGDWQWGMPSSGPGGAHSGVNLWATNLAGNYNNTMLAYLVSPPFGLGSNAMLGFWLWYDTEANFDGFNVKISTDDGVSWTVITPDGGYDGVGNTSNPLSGEEIYTGHVQGFWEFETFDLTAYGGAAVLFRIDFGSDGSVTYPGPYIDDFTIFGGGGAEPGYVAGVVTELSSGNPIEGAAVIGGNALDTTDASGNYLLELIPGTFSVTASAQYHNPVTVDDVVVIESETTFVDFALPTPMINVDTSIVEISADSGDVIAVTRNIANTGDGELEYSVQVTLGEFLFSVNNNRGEIIANNVDPDGAADVSPFSYSGGEPPVIADFQDSVFAVDLGYLGDTQLLGIEFDGTYFWVTGGNSGADPNILYKLDNQGNLVEQFNQNGTTVWGWRDMAFDGEFLYASDDAIIDQIDPATGDITGVTISGPENPNRGLAYNPDNDHFYTANFGSSIYEFDRNGTLINIWSNTKAIYGLAYDNVSSDGPWLWVFSQDGTPQQQISQFDPATGTYTGLSWQCALPDGATDGIAGGACLTTDWDPSIAALMLLGQGTPNDFIYGYEIAPFSRWLIVDPMSGVLQPNENVDLNITIDFSIGNLNYDSCYQATLSILNNTPETPEIPVAVNCVTGVEDGDGLPREFSISQNYPNPFNASTKLNFAISEPGRVTLSIYNLLGQKVQTLIDEDLLPGIYDITWNASEMSSGVYFARLTSADSEKQIKMVLLK